MKQATTKASPKAEVNWTGHQAFVISVDWLGKSVPSRLQYTPAKMKVGASVESALPREKITRSMVDDPANLPEGWKPPSASSIERKNAGLTGNVSIPDAH